MKLLTLNTHSLVEENYDVKLKDFVDTIYEEQPDIIALQEVNQTRWKAAVPTGLLTGYCSCDIKSVIREDNHVYQAVRMLREKGIRYYWTWLGMKIGYEKYDEGIALMSRSPILETDVLHISNIDDYTNWKTRKIIGIRTKQCPDEWFYSVHYGWWNDPEELFRNQWQKTNSHLQSKHQVWLLGDFNSPAHVREEGYDMITSSGWYDSYLLAAERDSGITVDKVIDGWKEKETHTQGMRIDQIWCKTKAVIHSSNVIFNGSNRNIISDHYGLIISREEHCNSESNSIETGKECNCNHTATKE